jgi:hypothetical protein
LHCNHFRADFIGVAFPLVEATASVGFWNFSISLKFQRIDLDNHHVCFGGSRGGKFIESRQMNAEENI